MRKFILVIVIACLGIAQADLVSAAKSQLWYMATDGDDVSGDGSQLNPFASLRQTTSMVSSGDTIFVADGIYSGPDNCNIELVDIYLTIVSQSDNPEACVFELGGADGIDLQTTAPGEEGGLCLKGLSFNEGSFAVSIQNLHPENGDATMTASAFNCSFRDNISGLQVRRGRETLVVEDCKFIGNSYCGLYVGEMDFGISNCRFVENGWGLVGFVM